MIDPLSIFVVGNSRSGTTLMGRILGNHYKIFTFHELHFFEQLWSEKDFGKELTQREARSLFAHLIKIQRAGYLDGSSHKSFLNECPNDLFLSGKTITRESLFKQFLYREARLNGKTIPCDQTPRNLLYIQSIFKIFPSAKVILMLRDPRDVVFSQKKKWKRRFLGAKNIPFSESIRSWFNYHPVTIALLWKQNFRAMQSLRRHPSVIIISYEQLIENPLEIVSSLCSFLKLPFEEKMLDVEFIGSSHAHDQSSTRGIVKNNGNWRNGGLSNTELYLCQAICKKEMELAAYELCEVKKSYLLVLISLMGLPFKIGFSLLLNLHRMRNLKESIQKRLNINK
jgi:omega-hydroxy-beta-dihydromenaquinone-9 sulfotransferase